MCDMEKDQDLLWFQRLTIKPAIAITILLLAALTIYTLCFLDKQLTPQTDVIVRVRSGVNGGTAHVRYYLEGHNYDLYRSIPPVFGNLTARIERNKLGLSKDIKQTHVVVSFYATHKTFGGQYPVGLRLGANNYPKDFWYYWTLFSKSTHTLGGILAFVAMISLCIGCKKDGVSTTAKTICCIFAFLCAFSLVFIF